MGIACYCPFQNVSFSPLYQKMHKIHKVHILPVIWYGWTFGLSHQGKEIDGGFSEKVVELNI